MGTSKWYNSVPVKDNCSLFAPTPQAIVHTGICPCGRTFVRVSVRVGDYPFPNLEINRVELMSNIVFVCCLLSDSWKVLFGA